MSQLDQIGFLLAAGKAPEDIAEGLGITQEELLTLSESDEMYDAFRRAVRLRQMSGYGRALERLAGQLSSENDSTVLKAAHEAFSLLDPSSETPFHVEEQTMGE